MEEILYQYNPWWEENVSNKEIKPRESYSTRLREYLDNIQIIPMTGLRRAAKTTFMFLQPMQPPVRHKKRDCL